MENMKPSLIVVTGPTASGKTAISIAICKRIDGEIVSADSMQLYRGMDIGTAKPNMAEQDGIRHHMLGVLDLSEHATASQYGDMAKAAISEIYDRGKIPVVCGGTGLYIDAITRPMHFSAPGNDALREELKAVADQPNGRRKLHNVLVELDPEAAQKLHENDVRRVIRAIESYRMTGKTLQELASEDNGAKGEFREILLAPQWPRDILYSRIDRRVDRMIESGLIQEVQSLLKQGLSSNSTAMQAIGYKEIVQALTGQCSMSEAIDRIKQASRNYAKRQLTWLRRDGRVHFIPAEENDTSQIAEEMIDICRKEGILK